MIYVIDGGSLLNRCPELFRPRSNLAETVLDFFERFADAFEGRSPELFFVLKGRPGDSRLPKRSRHGPWVLLFSFDPADLDDLMVETIRLARARDHVVIVTDNRPRAERCSFEGASRMRCAEFSQRLRSRRRGAREKDGLSDSSVENVQYWSNVFGLDLSDTIELKGPQRDEPSVPEEENGAE